jgi:type I restriction enzyme S subunit
MTLRVHPDEIVRSSTASLLAAHESWERVRLGDVADVLNGFAFKSEFFGDDGVPLLRIRDVGKSDTGTMYSGEYDESYLVQPGEIVAGMDGDFRVALWSGRLALLNQRVCKITIRDTELYEPRFLLHALPGYLDAVHAHTSSVTVKHLSSRTVQDIPLPLPPLNEQRRIVAAIEEHLSRLDAADASLAAALRRVSVYRAAALETAFTLEAPTATVGAVAKVGSGATPKRGRSDYWDGGTVPWVTSGQLNGEFVREPTALITKRALDETSVRLWPAGTLLVALYGEGRTRGRCAELTFEATTNQACAAIVLDESVADRTYVRRFFDAKYSENRRLASGGVQPNLSLGLIRSRQIPLPPLEEQKRIVAEVEERLSRIDAMRASIERAQRRSTALRRAVLERAFRGELVPQDPSDEPAEALLARIRATRLDTQTVTRRGR